MSEEKNNVEMITEFKMYITDLETERDSKEIDVSDLIFNDYIEFEFGNYEDEDYETLPYKDFKFFINDYSITIYSPQMEELQNQLQQKENIIKEVRDILRKYICNPSGLKDGWHIDCWNDKDISKLNEDLGILEKGNKYDN